MALSPLQPPDQRTVTVITTTLPSKTYSIDFDVGEIGEKIDGEAALRQFVLKAITTPRYRHLIYSDDYGCEIEELIGQDVTPPLLQTEIPRLIREALIYDDRISDVTAFDIQRDSDKLFVAFSVHTFDGAVVDINGQVVI